MPPVRSAAPYPTKWCCALTYSIVFVTFASLALVRSCVILNVWSNVPRASTKDIMQSDITNTSQVKTKPSDHFMCYAICLHWKHRFDFSWKYSCKLNCYCLVKFSHEVHLIGRNLISAMARHRRRPSIQCIVQCNKIIFFIGVMLTFSLLWLDYSRKCGSTSSPLKTQPFACQ